MKLNKVLILQLAVVLILISTSVYAALDTTINLTQSANEVKRGETVTVKLSLKDVDSSKRITSISGYINYNKDILEDITYNSIQKDSEGMVTIGNERLKVEDLTTATIDNMPSSDAYIGFNGNPSSNNDTKIVIDFRNGITSDVDLLSIDFKLKSDATLGEVENAISYSMFVINSNSDQTDEITKNINLTVVEGVPDEPTPVDPTPVEKTLTSISITKAPNKTEYEEGEKFDKSGMIVTAKYSDNSTKEITNYVYSPSGTLKASDKNIEITYTEGNVSKTVSQGIAVKSASITNTNTNRTTNTNTNTNRTTNTNTNRTTNTNTNRNTNTNTNRSANTNTNKNTNTKDNTVSGKNLPSTGTKAVVLPVIALILISYISYKKYLKYKDM